MVPRFHVALPLHADAEIELPPGAARHAQVLRLQPGAAITLFNGAGGEWRAEVLRMGRSDVQVRVDAHSSVDREAAVRVTLALGMPANERMDTLVEKATELGVATIQPLLCERSVLRLAGERAQKKVEHWRGIAVAASEQSGRTRVPVIEAVRSLDAWLRDKVVAADAAGVGGVAHGDTPPPLRWLLSLREAVPFDPQAAGAAATFLSGPEGGLTEAEEAAACHAGFRPVSLGARVMRADTAPLAVLAALMLR